MLNEAADRFGTPLYVYDLDALGARFDELERLFHEYFRVSYAIKSNPNTQVLAAIRPRIATFDASSFAEVERAVSAGAPPKDITLSGPGKRKEEIERAVALGIGELVVESVEDAEIASETAVRLGRKQNILVRINPLKVPRKFGASMAGRPSQFGVDEEVLPDALQKISRLPSLNLMGFHIYSGTNCLNAAAIAENFEIFLGIFREAARLTGRAPEKLIFGSGFGVPYLPDDLPLDVAALAQLISPIMADFRAEPQFSETEFVLEMGRWLIAPVGWLLTTVIGAKDSRGSQFRICDAGFNNHLAACGMMGSVFRRNWRYSNISSPNGKPLTYTLTGPLCTTIDMLAANIEMPELAVGDVISIENSGAYGLTASPTRFISHPEPREVVYAGGDYVEATESLLNHWN